MFWACLVFIRPAPAEDLLLLPSGDGGLYTQFIERLLEQPRIRPLHSRILPTPSQQEFPVIAAQDRHSLLLTIGTRALHYALAHTSKQPLLAVMVTAGAFQGHLRIHPGARQRLANGQLGALYLEQPLARQVALARVVHPEANRLGTVFGPGTRNLVPQLQSIASQQHFTLVSAQLEGNENPAQVIDRIIASSDIYLALPDSTLFNQGTARWVLYSALKWRHPVLAFSARYVQAGAMAAVYTSVTDAAVESSEIVARWLSGGKKALETPHEPRLYSISTNPRAADSLDRILPSVEQIRQAIDARVRQPQ